MPAKDTIHDAVKTALIKDGWTITHDPFLIRFGGKRLLADLGAERPIAAEKNGRKIVIEIKGFSRPSVIADLEQAIGQYSLYSLALSKVEPDRSLYLAVDKAVFERVFDTVSGHMVIEGFALNILIVDLAVQEVIKWIP
jgi:hypothetical protein